MRMYPVLFLVLASGAIVGCELPAECREACEVDGDCADGLVCEDTVQHGTVCVPKTCATCFSNGRTCNYDTETSEEDGHLMCSDAYCS